MCHCAPVLRIHIPLPAHDGSGSACVLDAHREYAPPENASECASTVRPSAESFLIYSASASAGSFEIASSHALGLEVHYQQKSSLKVSGRKLKAPLRPRRGDRRRDRTRLQRDHRDTGAAFPAAAVERR